MRRSRLRDARGAVLLEVVIALALLATVGSGAAWLASESIRTVSRVHEEEHRIRSAARLLTAVSLWPRDDLDRHLGTTRQGPWRLRVARSEPILYTITLLDSLAANVVLRTAVLRDEVDR